MNKAELIVELAEKAGLKKQKAKKVLEAYMEIVTEKMSQNEEISIVGFHLIAECRLSGWHVSTCRPKSVFLCRIRQVGFRYWHDIRN